MEIEKAEFVASAGALKDCPKAIFPEYAFIGRSNVGKSSLINMLTEKKELARTSGTPGKTVSMNFFRINGKWTLVDLPGYGYAKRSRSLREAWEKTLWNYLQKREVLVSLFVLVDSRIPPQASDLEFIDKLGEAGIPFAIAFTKLDKLKKQEAEANIAAFEEKLKEHWEDLPPRFATSALDKTGRKEILKYIGSLNTEFHKNRAQ